MNFSGRDNRPGGGGNRSTKKHHRKTNHYIDLYITQQKIAQKTLDVGFFGGVDFRWCWLIVMAVVVCYVFIFEQTHTNHLLAAPIPT